MSADMFYFMKNCLLTFNYPLAHSMSEEELTDVFHTSNRCFLISWMLKLLHSAYEEALGTEENDEALLGDMVHELGFCTKKDKLAFITGELPVVAQVKILSNMFRYITDVKSECEAHAVTNDEITALANTNLNLFPKYGDIKSLKKSERASKASEFVQEIGGIKAKLATVEISDKAPLSVSKYSKDLQEFLKQILEDVPKIRAVMESHTKNYDGTKKEDAIKLDAASPEILKKCSDNLRLILQFVKDIDTIEDFAKNDVNTHVQENESVNEAYEMLKILRQEVLCVVKCTK